MPIIAIIKNIITAITTIEIKIVIMSDNNIINLKLNFSSKICESCVFIICLKNLLIPTYYNLVLIKIYQIKFVLFVNCF